MGQLPRTPLQRQAIVHRSMLVGNGGGRTTLPAPEPRPLGNVPWLDPLRKQIPFGQIGPVEVGDRSNPYAARILGKVDAFVMTARTAGAGDSTFQINVNGAAAGNVLTLPSGLYFVELDIVDIGDIPVVPTDILDLEVLSVGAGLSDIGGDIDIAG